MHSHYLWLAALHCVQSQTHTDHTFQVRRGDRHVFKTGWKSHFLREKVWFEEFTDNTVLIVGWADKNWGVCVEEGGGSGFLEGFLFERDKFEDFLSLRGFGKDLLIFNLFHISFFLDVRIEKFE